MLDGASQVIFDTSQWFALAVIREVTNLVGSEVCQGVGENKRFSGLALPVKPLTPFKPKVAVKTGEFWDGANYSGAPQILWHLPVTLLEVAGNLFVIRPAFFESLFKTCSLVLG
jgi:hypothetical protein